MYTTYLAIFAACVFAVQGYSTTTSSFVSCADTIACDVYNKDPKTGGVMRCKPRASSTMHCSTEYCCATPPSFVRCNTVITCMPGSNYKKDPKVGGVMRCKEEAGSTEHCDYDYCCEPFTAPTPPPPPPPPPPPTFVRCNTVVTCMPGSEYKTDPKVGGIMRCKPRQSSSMACDYDYCCKPFTPPPPPPPTSFVRCDTVITCMPGSNYKTDPKVGGVMRCKPATGSTMHCTYDYCCQEFYGPTY